MFQVKMCRSQPSFDSTISTCVARSESISNCMDFTHWENRINGIRSLLSDYWCKCPWIHIKCFKKPLAQAWHSKNSFYINQSCSNRCQGPASIQAVQSVLCPWNPHKNRRWSKNCLGLSGLPFRARSASWHLFWGIPHKDLLCCYWLILLLIRFLFLWRNYVSLVIFTVSWLDYPNLAPIVAVYLYL